MATPSKQIGGSLNYNLLWQISKQLEQLICIRSGNCTTTTTSTTETPLIFTTTFQFSYPADYIILNLDLDGSQCYQFNIGYIENETVLSEALSVAVGFLGIWSNNGDLVTLITRLSNIEAYCSNMTGMYFSQDINYYRLI